jgi:hypothetical protein
MWVLGRVMITWDSRSSRSDIEVVLDISILILRLI